MTYNGVFFYSYSFYRWIKVEKFYSGDYICSSLIINKDRDKKNSSTTQFQFRIRIQKPIYQIMSQNRFILNKKP